MPTWVAMTALLLWLTCPVVYTVAVGRHYARRCHDELAAVRDYVDELHESLYDPDPPTAPIPITGRHHRP